MFDEISELIEQSSANTINICRMGGMSAILELMCAHDYIDVRVKAARIFVSCTQNNIKVQNFVARLGTVNLASIVDIE